MYSSFAVNNFRGFRNFSIDGLERINLISGKNNVGKTALLEAIWFHHGLNPELGLRLNKFRGISEVSPTNPCLELFRNLDISEKMEFSSKDDIVGQTKESMYSRDASIMSLQEEQDDNESKQAGLPMEGVAKELVVDYEINGKAGSSIARFSTEEVKFIRDERNIKKPVARFLIAGRKLGGEEIESLGQLQIKGRDEEIIQLLKILEPTIKKISVIVRGTIASIWIDSGLGVLLPIQIMGDGLSRWLMFVLAILRAENGLVLVDEIENGIHYSIMASIWKKLANLAAQYNVQIIATTHSAECIRYAHKAFSTDYTKDFKYFRLEKIEGITKVIDYDMNTLEAALENELEFR